MEKELTFEELYEAYNLCLKNKKKKMGTYNFVNEDLCKNLIKLLNELNKREYVPKQSNCYVITDPALREIYAAQFSDRIVQHFYMNEMESILEKELVDGCCSCRKGRGNDYALNLLKKYLIETSKKGTRDCYFLKIDLSGYFMSINRKQVSNKFIKLIEDKYIGNHKELLLYLTPIIFENNPSFNCIQKCTEKMRRKVPDRRKMNPKSDFGMAIGNLTSQAASNLNLNEFDNYVEKELKLEKYIRYVDDIVIISADKEKLIRSLNYIEDKLKESNQKINIKKTQIDTSYHGVPFLGKVSYPYGYQKPKKQTIIRTYQKAQKIQYTDISNLLSKANSQIGTLKNYNCRKLILNYNKILQIKTKNLIKLEEKSLKFKSNYSAISNNIKLVDI